MRTGAPATVPSPGVPAESAAHEGSDERHPAADNISKSRDQRIRATLDTSGGMGKRSLTVVAGGMGKRSLPVWAQCA